MHYAFSCKFRRLIFECISELLYMWTKILTERLDSHELLLCLLQVSDDFDRQDFHKMCWTLCSKKNLQQSQLLISNDDSFKIWCIFNFLSEDRYPLIIVTEEVSVLMLCFNLLFFFLISLVF